MSDDDRRGDWMQTFGGRKLWPLDVRPEDLHLEDIAHSLALQCRFRGHCRFHYSVAQHSVLVSRIVPEPLAGWGLMHDAAEAVIGDNIRPTKRHTYFGVPGSCYPASILSVPFSDMEKRIMACVVLRFGLSVLHDDRELTEADDRALKTEVRDVMGGELAGDWKEAQRRGDPAPLVDAIREMSWRDAEREFLSRAAELGIK